MSRKLQFSKLFFAFATIVTFADVSAAASLESPIYSFSGPPDGAFPISGVVVDSKTGNIYGTTLYGGQNNNGAVFQLTAPSSPNGRWTETVIYSFGASPDAQGPVALIENQQTGTLFGLTWGGGANNAGTLFELTPSTSGTWSESVLYSFTEFAGGVGNQALIPALAMDEAGNVYAVLSTWGQGATVYLFTAPPPAQGNLWSPVSIFRSNNWSCGDPLGWNIVEPQTNGLAFNNKGDVVVSSPCNDGVSWAFSGLIYELDPPSAGGSAWTEKTLFDFAAQSGQFGVYPSGTLSIVGDAIYGTTLAGTASYAEGTVFSLTPPTGSQSQWSITYLTAVPFSYGFLGPAAGITVLNGSLYGTTGEGNGGTGGDVLGGSIFAVTGPPPSVTVLSLFQGPPGDGKTPIGPLVPAAGNGAGAPALYGATEFGGSYSQGTIFEVTVPPQPQPVQIVATCGLRAGTVI